VPVELKVGLMVGIDVGVVVGLDDGVEEGLEVGLAVGFDVGWEVGLDDGNLVGCVGEEEVGTVVGTQLPNLSYTNIGLAGPFPGSQLE